MQFLFDSRGRHIANEVSGRLHTPAGKHFGHFMAQLGVFIDLDGHYLGEIVRKNRLMVNRRSPHKTSDFCVYGDYGTAGSFGTPSSPGGVGAVAGHADVAADRLQ
jgi:hypothetical protein